MQNYNLKFKTKLKEREISFEFLIIVFRFWFLALRYTRYERLTTNNELLGDRLVVGHEALDLAAEVRILLPQP